MFCWMKNIFSVVKYEKYWFVQLCSMSDIIYTKNREEFEYLMLMEDPSYVLGKEIYLHVYERGILKVCWYHITLFVLKDTLDTDIKWRKCKLTLKFLIETANKTR